MNGCKIYKQIMHVILGPYHLILGCQISTIPFELRQEIYSLPLSQDCSVTALSKIWLPRPQPPSKQCSIPARQLTTLWQPNKKLVDFKWRRVQKASLRNIVGWGSSALLFACQPIFTRWFPKAFSLCHWNFSIWLTLSLHCPLTPRYANASKDMQTQVNLAKQYK